MGWWERSLIFGAGNPYQSPVQLYFHYIDNLLFICSKEIGNLKNWLNYLNDNELHLKFTGYMNPKSISYLDVILTSEGDQVTFACYRKLVAGNLLLSQNRFGAPPPYYQEHSCWPVFNTSVSMQ